MQASVTNTKRVPWLHAGQSVPAGMTPSTEQVSAEVLDPSLVAASAGPDLPNTMAAAAAAAAKTTTPGPATCATNDVPPIIPVAIAMAASAPAAVAATTSPTQVVAGNTVACVSEQAVAAEAGVVRQSSKFSPLYWFTRAQPTNYDM